MFGLASRSKFVQLMAQSAVSILVFLQSCFLRRGLSQYGLEKMERDAKQDGTGSCEDVTVVLCELKH